MTFNLRIMLCLLTAVFVLTGCYNKPVRHLSSDAAMLEIGRTGSEDVLIYLGDPDEQEEVGDGVEKWLYKKKDMSLLERIPYAGRFIGSPEYSQVVVTLDHGIVTGVSFSQSDDDDLDWADDYSWQEKKK